MQKLLSEFNNGETAELFLIVNMFELKTTKAQKQYLNLELRDKSLPINAKMWDGFYEIFSKLELGAIVKVKAIVDEYNNQPQMIIKKIRMATDEDNVSTDDFMPKSERPFEEMKDELNSFIDEIKNKHIRQLIDLVLNEENFNKYSRVPAGKAWHHAYIHGLLEHTLEIIKICKVTASFHKEINTDILLAGAILHDFGKIEELSFESTFDYTDKGKFIGHIVIAAMKVSEAIATIDGFPEYLKEQIIHLILSHQGKLEYATPVEPKTLEAVVLHHADELSAKTNAYRNAINLEKSTGKKWTKYLPLAGTSLFIPDEDDQNNDDIKDTLFS